MSEIMSTRKSDSFTPTCRSQISKCDQKGRRWQWQAARAWRGYLGEGQRVGEHAALVNEPLRSWLRNAVLGGEQLLDSEDGGRGFRLDLVVARLDGAAKKRDDDRTIFSDAARARHGVRAVWPHRMASFIGDGRVRRAKQRAKRSAKRQAPSHACLFRQPVSPCPNPALGSVCALSARADGFAKVSVRIHGSDSILARRPAGCRRS